MSSERRTAKTYAGKKRISTLKGDTVEESEVSGGEEEQADASEYKGKKNSVRRPVDPLELPGPEPRTKRRSPQTPRTPGKSVKPPSAIGSSISLVSRKGPATVENATHHDQTSDISDKEGRTRSVRTTEAERRAYFESHPDVAEVEPHRVRCRCCDKWLKLSSTQNYAIAPWKLHKKACSSEIPCTRRPRHSSGQEDIRLANGAEEDDASSVAPSVSASEVTGTSVASRSLSSSERQKALEEDELTGEVRPDSVFCSACTKWVKLSSRTAFQLKNWLSHTERVHGRTEAKSKADFKGSVPSSRVREAEKKLQLVNDPEASDFTASRVTCKACSADVALSGTVPYELNNWIAHKATCAVLSVESAHKIGSKPVSTVSVASLASDKVSRASTDRTCVAPDTSAAIDISPAPVRQKRAREDDEAGEETKAARVRTSSYSSVDLKPSGPWGWLKLPWETFKRGFAEGLGAGRGEASKTDE